MHARGMAATASRLTRGASAFVSSGSVRHISRVIATSFQEAGGGPGGALGAGDGRAGQLLHPTISVGRMRSSGLAQLVELSQGAEDADGAGEDGDGQAQGVGVGETEGGWGEEEEMLPGSARSVTSPDGVAVKQLGSDAGGSDGAPPLQPAPPLDPPPGGAGASGDGMVGNPRSKRYGSDREGREVVAAASQQQPGPPPPGSPSPRRPIQTPGVIEATGWQALEPMPGAVGAEENIKGP